MLKPPLLRREVQDLCKGKLCHVRGLEDRCCEDVKFSPTSSADAAPDQPNAPSEHLTLPQCPGHEKQARETVTGWRRPRRHAVAWSVLQHEGHACSDRGHVSGLCVSVDDGAPRRILHFDMHALVTLKSRETGWSAHKAPCTS